MRTKRRRCRSSWKASSSTSTNTPRTTLHDASEESIAKYREYGDKLRAAEYFGVDIYSESDKDSMYSQMTQYLQGAIDANTMLQKLDKTVKMMILEKQ